MAAGLTAHRVCHTLVLVTVISLGQEWDLPTPNWNVLGLECMGTSRFGGCHLQSVTVHVAETSLLGDSCTSSRPSSISLVPNSSGLQEGAGAGPVTLQAGLCRRAAVLLLLHSPPASGVTPSLCSPREPDGHLPACRERSVLCSSDANTQGKHRAGQMFTKRHLR